MKKIAEDRKRQKREDQIAKYSNFCLQYFWIFFEEYFSLLIICRQKILEQIKIDREAKKQVSFLWKMIKNQLRYVCTESFSFRNLNQFQIQFKQNLRFLKPRPLPRLQLPEITTIQKFR